MTTENKFQVGDEVEGTHRYGAGVVRGKFEKVEHDGDVLIRDGGEAYRSLLPHTCRLISRPTLEADRLFDVGCCLCGAMAWTPNGRALETLYADYRKNHGSKFCRACAGGENEEHWCRVDAEITRRKSLAQPFTCPKCGAAMVGACENCTTGINVAARSTKPAPASEAPRSGACSDCGATLGFGISGKCSGCLNKPAVVARPCSVCGKQNDDARHDTCSADCQAMAMLNASRRAELAKLKRRVEYLERGKRAAERCRLDERSIERDMIRDGHHSGAWLAKYDAASWEPPKQDQVTTRHDTPDGKRTVVHAGWAPPAWPEDSEHEGMV